MSDAIFSDNYVAEGNQKHRKVKSSQVNLYMTNCCEKIKYAFLVILKNFFCSIVNVILLMKATKNFSRKVEASSKE